jgi:hypothetical protein
MGDEPEAMKGRAAAERDSAGSMAGEHQCPSAVEDNLFARRLYSQAHLLVRHYWVERSTLMEALHASPSYLIVWLEPSGRRRHRLRFYNYSNSGELSPDCVRLEKAYSLRI